MRSPRGLPTEQLESRRSLLLLHEEADVDPYHDAAKLVSNVTLSAEVSTRIIRVYAERWERA